MDHHARWGSLAELHAAFEQFVEPAAGVVLPVAAEAAGDGGRHLAANPLYARIEAARTVRRFDASAPGPAQLPLVVPGQHNRANARAALAAIGLAGLDAEAAAAALADFPGVRRRLEVKGSRNGVRIYDDYGHHPTEVRAALSALRELRPARLIAVFQPHLYSRTKALAEEFGAALALADEVAVLDVYPAREQPIGELAGVSGLDVARAAAERMGGRRVWWLPEAASAERALADLLDRTGERLDRTREAADTGPVLVTIGAGDIFKLGEALMEGGG
jgi:UDP-N-acetylmuramate--alanine ligase